MNPFDFITDDQYEMLKPFFSEKKVRNHDIRQKYAKYRKNKINQNEAIELIIQDYPYLQWDTVRKLAYQK